MTNAFLSHSDAAIRNRNIVLRYIRENAPVSRTDIWEALDMSRASVTQIIKQFQDNGLIIDGFHGESTGGRKPLYIEFDGSNIIYFAFDWISKNLYLLNLNGDVLYEIHQKIDENTNPEVFSNILKKSIREIADKCKFDTHETAGFVLSMPGIISVTERTIILSVILGWQNVNMLNLFEDLFGENVYLERMLNMLALAEADMRKKNNKASHVQLFNFDKNGIGVSTVIRGNIQHGFRHMHGELGHIKLNSNVLCSCGQKGCIEAIIKKLLQESGGKITNEILDYLAIGISTAINICDTEIVLTGYYAERLTKDQMEYLKEAVIERITSPDIRNFGLDCLKDTERMVQLGFCTYMFGCIFPT